MVERTPELEAKEFLNIACWDKLLADEDRTRLLRAWRRDPSRDIGDLAAADGGLAEEAAGRIRDVQARGGPADDEDAFGDLAVTHGFLTEQELWDCLGEQERSRKDGYTPLLASVAIEEGYLTEEQVHILLREQKQDAKGLLVALHPELQRREFVPQGVGALLRSPRFLVSAIVFVAAVALLFLRMAGLSVALRQKRVCEACGHEFTCDAGVRQPRCPKCRGDRLPTVLYCTACDRSFPLRITGADPRSLHLEPCPGCGTLDHTVFPDTLRNDLRGLLPDEGEAPPEPAD